MPSKSSSPRARTPDRQNSASSHPFADIQAVSFDLDDTFWDCAPAIRQAELASYEWMSRHTPRITSRYSEASLSARRTAYYTSRPDLRGDVTAMRKASFVQLFEESGYPAALADEAFEVFYRARSKVTLYPGVQQLLEALRPRYRLAAITNGNADLALIGIDHHFHSVHRATLAYAAKPAVAMFDACLAGFDLPAAALLHVGDSPETDVAGAHNAGAHACWYNPLGQDWPDDRSAPRVAVSSLAELECLLVQEC